MGTGEEVFGKELRVIAWDLGTLGEESRKYWSGAEVILRSYGNGGGQDVTWKEGSLGRESAHE